MSLVAGELVIRPFREVVQRGNEVVAEAQQALDKGKEDDQDVVARCLLNAGQALRKEGDRALSRVQPLCEMQVAKLGDAFNKLIIQNEEITQKRLKLDDLLYDFEDFMQPDSFDKDRFGELQTATKSLALAVIELTRRARVEPPRDQEQPLSVFPKLPPLPPLPPSMVGRPESRSSRQSSVLSIPRSSILNEEIWPLPPSKQRQSRSRGVYGSLTGTDTIPPIPATSQQLIASSEVWQKVDARDDVPVAGTWMTPASSSRTQGPEMLHTELERTKIVATPPTSPMDDSPSQTTRRVSPSLQHAHVYASSYRESALTPPHDHFTTRSSDRQSPMYAESSPQLSNHRASTLSSGTSNTSRIATALGYPNWRTVDRGIGSKMNGLCAGATTFRTGGLWEGVKKVDKSTNASQQANPYAFNQVYSAPQPVFAETMAQCINCEFAHKYNDLSKDFDRDEGANFTAEGIHFRKRFLYKSHVTARILSERYYTCVFCTIVGSKVHESDANVFATVDQLLRHLARHSWPLPEIPGLIVLYGTIASNHPNARDYDINLTNHPSNNTPVEEVRLGYLPVATAIKDNCKTSSMRKLPQPDHETEALQFFTGARIVGVEFPQQWAGKWCSGWHDGAFGAFPAKTVQLEPPQRKGMLALQDMDSPRSGVTRWKWDSKGGSGAGWLTFDKGDHITNLNWDDPDAWYWSGSNSKGRFGIFPSSHMKIESIQDGSLDIHNSRPSSGKSMQKGRSLFKSKRVSTAASLDTGISL